MSRWIRVVFLSSACELLDRVHTDRVFPASGCEPLDQSVFLSSPCELLDLKQKTAYEIMSGDWSSDVCSSDPASRLRLLVISHYIYVGLAAIEIGRASCRERVCQYV